VSLNIISSAFGLKTIHAFAIANYHQRASHAGGVGAGRLHSGHGGELLARGFGLTTYGLGGGGSCAQGKGGG
jgi:hypothetical protein